MRKLLIFLSIFMLIFSSCGAKKAESSDTDHISGNEQQWPVFNADSAFSYVEEQVAFGPRVPNTAAHQAAGLWLADELRRHGAEVAVQKAALKAFDGTILQASNIIGSFNPEAPDRLLLLAHWDCRPWADEEPDEKNHKTPVDGANDGASGVGVLLELARILGENPQSKGIDILFVDAEDWGTHDDDSSWALGAAYFVDHPFKPGYRPSEAILLDMVGGRNAVFRREYFSQQAAPGLNDKIWNAAARIGRSDRFINEIGGGVTDDHLRFIEAGIPAIDIIEFQPNSPTGFNPTWHTLSDNLQNIDKNTLHSVGATLVEYIYSSR